MLEQDRTICPRNQHMAGGRKGVLIYVRRNTDYRVSKEALGVSNLHSGLVQLAGLTVIKS